MTQISFIGYIGISELVCFVVAPVVFWRNFDFFWRCKMLPYLGLAVLWMLFALNADILIYRNPMETVLKGVASPYCVFSVSVCALVLLRDRFQRLNWFVVGSALSYVLSTVVFQRGSVVGSENLMDEGGGSAMNAVMSYKLYWLMLVWIFLLIPVQIRFRTIPLWVSLALTFGAAFFALFGGGRSTFLVTLVSAGILIMGASVRSRAYRPRPRSFVPLAVFMVVMGLASKGLYTYTVKQGWLGDDEMQKYEKQATEIGTSALSLLMSGRSECWIALSAIKDKPFFGHGYKPPDFDGYAERWVEKYGDALDVRRMREQRMRGIKSIPAHSHILGAWLYHGAGGLLFWVYVLYLIYKMMTVWVWYVPDWFGWMATSVPMWLWAIFFSPFGERVPVVIMCSMILLARCVHRRLISPVGIGQRPMVPNGLEMARRGVRRML